MPTADRVFLDTNIIVYGRLRHAPLFDKVQERLKQMAAAGDSLWLSRQVLREFLAVMSRGQGLTAIPPMSELIADVEHFCQRFLIAEDGSTVTRHLTRLLLDVPCAGKQVHDANIVATMQAHGIGRLLTHNTDDFQRFSAHIFIEPLVP